MNCKKGNAAPHEPSHARLDRFEMLHPEGRKLIHNWFHRGWAIHDASGEDCFELFIYAWFAVNGWAACVTQADGDRVYLDGLTRDATLCETFQALLNKPTSGLAREASAFAELWPIFAGKNLRSLHIHRHNSGERHEVIADYLAAGATKFEPQYWEQHRNAGETVPLDWPHTLSAIYHVRCNLFHREKFAHSEMDQRVVSAAFRTLICFFYEAHYLD